MFIDMIADLPMSGTYSDVAGMFSAMSSMKTENASSTVKPRLTFSPEAAGSKKLHSVSSDRNAHGMMMLNA